MAYRLFFRDPTHCHHFPTNFRNRGERDASHAPSRRTLKPDLLDGDDVRVVLDGFRSLGGGFIFQGHNGSHPVPLRSLGKVHAGDIDLKGSECRPYEIGGPRLVEVLDARARLLLSQL